MKYPVRKNQPTSSQVVPFTGGIKEDVAQLEMKPGELLDCINYQEVDGVYHGYASIKGYERYDGQPLASEVDVIGLTDYGIDSHTKLLLASDMETTIKDRSRSRLSITNVDVINDGSAINHKFLSSSYYFNGTTSNLEVSSNGVLNLEDKDFTIDMLVNSKSVVSLNSLVNKSDSYFLNIHSNHIEFSYSTDGTTFPHTLISAGTLVNGVEYHIAVVRRGDTIYLFIDGKKDANEYTCGTDFLFTNVSPLEIGSSFDGWLDEVRMSEGYKWFEDFDIPKKSYTIPSYYAFSVDDSAREVARSLIQEVPGTGPIAMVGILDTSVFTVRNKGATNAWIYSDSNLGWAERPATSTGGEELLANGDYEYINARFDLFTGHQREEVSFFVNGVNSPMYYDGIEYTPIVTTHLPDIETPKIHPTHLADYKNRLWLAYPDGRLWYSAVGDPMNFDPVSNAGVIYMEDEITALQHAPGDVMIVFCKNSIQVIKSLADVSKENTSAELQSLYKFKNESFSNRSGAIAHTPDRVLGDVLYLDDRGLTTMTTTEEFGDFKAASLSKNIQRTLLAKKNLVTDSVVVRDYNQYRLFFNDKDGLIFTFNEKKEVKGVTKIQYKNSVECVTEGEDKDGNLLLLFGSSNGFVYKMDSGTSFDGEEIETRINTSFHTYRTPTNWKNFKKIILETQAEKGLTFYGRPEYNYANAQIPRSSLGSYIAVGVGGVWGYDAWGLFAYGAGGISSHTLYIEGYGVNMSMAISTFDKYSEQHVLNNMIVEYSQNSRMM